MPGFNTFRVDTDAGTAYNLVETTLDITSTYGHDEIVPLEDITHYDLDYDSQYNFTNLSAKNISSQIDVIMNGTAKTTLEYLTNKIGYNALNPDLFE